MARRRPFVDTLVSNAARQGNAKRAALGAVVAGGALSAAKLGWDRIASKEDPRRFRLREQEPASAGLRRMARGQIDGAIEQLERDSEQGVHEARKSFKRLRAIVRLARDELGDEIYRRENRELRDLGRRLSGARDSQVLLETLDGLASAHEPPPGLRESLAAEHALAERQLTGVRGGAVRELHEIRERVSVWPLEQDGLDSLAPGFRRIYRRARRAYRRAQRDPTTENLHELRKRTKDLWYCAQILRPASHKQMKRLAKKAHELSDLIGEEHDLAILAERIPDGDPSAQLIERRRKALRNDGLRLAQRVYRKKPRKVARPLKQAAA